MSVEGYIPFDEADNSAESEAVVKGRATLSEVKVIIDGGGSSSTAKTKIDSAVQALSQCSDPVAADLIIELNALRPK